MERTISREERIKRAEEIYNRRRIQNSGVRVRASTVNNQEKIKYNLLKKMVLQILICLFIYLILYLIKNTNYIFSEDVINKTRSFLSYDINITEYYNNTLKPWIENQRQNILNNEINENTQSNEEINVELNGIGGGDEIESNEESSLKEINEENNLEQEKNETEIALETSADEEIKEEKVLTQMEIDANEIKSKYSFIIPLKGVISSRFGPRTPTQIVSANHGGIDIAVNEGTVFCAAMEGKITTVSSYGSYGNHVIIENGNVMTIYAHCKKIYVKQGDFIKQGELLGEVGQTGNATGPHLHFEIRKDGRKVDPEYVLSF